MLDQINAHPRDASITFDEPTHVYTISGAKGYTSVTTFNHKHFEEFDADKVIANMLRGSKMRDPQYKYFGQTPEEIKAGWSANGAAASGAGTKLHYDIESFYNGLGDNGNTSIEFGYFKQFVADHPHLVPYRTEWMVWYEEYQICGSIDMVFTDTRTGKLCIYDWKRVQQIEFEGFGNKCAITECISHIPDCNFYKYSLQLNMYREIVEAKYGFEIGDMVLVVLHPANDTYICVPCEDMRAEVHALLAQRAAAKTISVDTV